jgi:hypothetical protein
MKRLGVLEPENLKTPAGAPMAFINAALASQTDECILWPYAKTKHAREYGGGPGKDYGSFNLNGRTKAVHAYVCEVVHGPKPDRHEAAHNCGHQPCINPQHLRWATREENQADRVEHGTSNRGERQWASKLTADVVLDLRRRRAEGPWDCLAEAERLGINRKSVEDAVKGRTWGWLAPETIQPMIRPRSSKAYQSQIASLDRSSGAARS